MLWCRCCGADAPTMISTWKCSEPARLYAGFVAVVTTIGSLAVVTTADFPGWVKTLIVVCAAAAPVLQGERTRADVYAPDTVAAIRGDSEMG